jgi:hypothetical protein
MLFLMSTSGHREVQLRDHHPGELVLQILQICERWTVINSSNKFQTRDVSKNLLQFLTTYIKELKLDKTKK